MGRILEAAKAFFEEEDWGYDEALDGLQLRFGGEHGQWRCFARVREDEGQFLFYSYAPMEIYPDDYLAVAEYISRANFGLFIGNFELNFANGTLQYRTSIDVEGEADRLSSPLLKHLVYQNVLTMDKYLPGLRAIIDQGVAPSDAIQQVENPE